MNQSTLVSMASRLNKVEEENIKLKNLINEILTSENDICACDYCKYDIQCPKDITTCEGYVDGYNTLSDNTQVHWTCADLFFGECKLRESHCKECFFTNYKNFSLKNLV